MHKIILLILCLFYQITLLSQAKKVTVSEVDSLVKKGNQYFREADFENSIKTLRIALIKAKAINNDSLASFACNRIARNFSELSEKNKAIFFYNKAMFYAIRSKDQGMVTTININLGNLYSFENNKNYKEAIAYYHKALQYSQKVKDSADLVLINMNIAETYFEQNEFDKGYKYFLFFNKHFDKYGDPVFTATKCQLNGMYYSYKNENEKAKEHFLKGINYGKKIILKEDKQYLYLEYSKFLFKMGDYKNAYANLQMYNTISDKLFNKTNIVKASIQGVNLQLDDYKSDIQKMEIDNKQQSKSLKNSTIINVLILIVAIILFLLLFVLFKNFNLKNKNNLELINTNHELKIAKENAEQASIIKTQFVSTISHELRTPLYGVIGITNIISEEYKELINNEHLNSLKFSAKYLLALVNDILQINKLEDSKRVLEKKSFNIFDEITAIKKSLEFIAIQNKNIFNVNIDQSIPKNVISDEIRLSQILMNLLSNALKFTKNGEVNLSVSLEKIENQRHFIYFEIKDNGIGIPLKDQEKIFDKFTQLHRQDNDYQGTGLGLTIVKDLLELFNSKIYIDSKEHEGSKFSFTIAFEADKNIILNEVEKETFTDVILKVLVVEDNKINQMVTKKIIESNFHICHIVSNGFEAIQIIKNETFDIILMDINMPEIDGYQTSLKIRELGFKTPIIALTAFDKNEVLNKALTSGINDVLIKPFEPENLFKMLQDIIKHNK